MFKKIKNFGKSLAWHIGSGMPKSSQQEIDSRYNVCLQCTSFDPMKSECTVCGCNVNNQNIFMNKLAWKDSKCPLNKW